MPNAMMFPAGPGSKAKDCGFIVMHCGTNNNAWTQCSYGGADEAGMALERLDTLDPEYFSWNRTECVADVLKSGKFWILCAAGQRNGAGTSGSGSRIDLLRSGAVSWLTLSSSETNGYHRPNYGGDVANGLTFNIVTAELRPGDKVKPYTKVYNVSSATSVMLLSFILLG